LGALRNPADNALQLGKFQRWLAWGSLHDESAVDLEHFSIMLRRIQRRRDSFDIPLVRSV
jgi:hypothetical protein